jgi:dual oxidase
MFAVNDLNPECKPKLHNSTCIRQNDSQDFLCYHLPQISKSNVEECTEPETYDYFSGSEASFILTFIGNGLFILGKKCRIRNF